MPTADLAFSMLEERCYGLVIWSSHIPYAVPNGDPAKLGLTLHFRWVCALDGLR